MAKSKGKKKPVKKQIVLPKKKKISSTVKKKSFLANTNKYRQTQRIVSEFIKQNNIDLKGNNFNKITSKIYHASKDTPIHQIEINIDILFWNHSGIENFSLVNVKEHLGEFIRFWEVSQSIGDERIVDKNIPLVVNNDTDHTGINNYTGTVGDFIDNVYDDVLANLNRWVKDTFPNKADRYFVYLVSFENNTLILTLNSLEQEAPQYQKFKELHEKDDPSKGIVKLTKEEVKVPEKEIPEESKIMDEEIKKTANLERLIKKKQSIMDDIKFLKELGEKYDKEMNQFRDLQDQINKLS